MARSQCDFISTASPKRLAQAWREGIEAARGGGLKQLLRGDQVRPT